MPFLFGCSVYTMYTCISVRQWAIFELPLLHNQPLHKTFHIKVRFDFDENKPLRGTHFHMNGFGQRRDVTQRERQFGAILSSTFKWYCLLCCTTRFQLLHL